jgi:hypothetical protein
MKKRTLISAAMAVSAFSIVAISYGSTLHLTKAQSSAPIAPLYYTTNGLGIQNDAFSTLYTDHVTSLSLGTLFIKKSSPQCTIANMWDGVDNPITAYLPQMQAYVKQGGTIQFTFGGNPGSSSLDPFLLCNQNDLTGLIQDTINSAKNPAGESLASGVDFDIENNINNGADDNAFWNKIGGVITALKAKNPNLKITITIPEDTQTWAPGYNQAMQTFFKAYSKDVTLNLIYNYPGVKSATQMQAYESIMSQSLQDSGFTGKVMITAAWTSANDGTWYDLSPIAPEDQQKFNQTLKDYISSQGDTYVGTSIWAADKPYTGQLYQPVIDTYDVVAGNKPAPAPGPKPTSGQLVLSYTNAGTTGYGTLTCWNNLGHAATLGTVNLHATTPIGQTGVGAYTTAVCVIDGAGDGATFTFDGKSAWAATPTSGVTVSCNGTACSIGASSS